MVLSSFQVFFSLVLFSVRIAVPFSIRRYGNILLMLLGCLKCFVVPQLLVRTDKLTIHLITGVGISLHLVFSSGLNLLRVTKSHITFLCVSQNSGVAFRLSSKDRCRDISTWIIREYAPIVNPLLLNYDRVKSCQKLIVRTGLCGNGQVPWPFFFDGNVAGNSYLEIVNMEILPLLVMLLPHQFQYD